MCAAMTHTIPRARKSDVHLLKLYQLHCGDAQRHGARVFRLYYSPGIQATPIQNVSAERMVPMNESRSTGLRR